MVRDRNPAKLKRRMHRKKRQEDTRSAGAIPIVLLGPGQDAPPLDGSKMSDALEQVARPLLDDMAERKRQLFPHDDRLVMDVTVEDRGDHFYITAASVRWPHGSSQRSR